MWHFPDKMWNICELLGQIFLDKNVTWAAFSVLVVMQLCSDVYSNNGKAELFVICAISVYSVGKRLGQWEHVHSSRRDYLVSLPQLCCLQTAGGAPGLVGWEAVSKRQEDRRGHIPGRGKRLHVILSPHVCRFNLHSWQKEVASTAGGRDFKDEIDGFSLWVNASSLTCLSSRVWLQELSRVTWCTCLLLFFPIDSKRASNFLQSNSE